MRKDLKVQASKMLLKKCSLMMDVMDRVVRWCPKASYDSKRYWVGFLIVTKVT